MIVQDLIKKCPICNGEVFVSGLQCVDCGVELKNNFKLSVFEKLNEEQYNFLITFLVHQGSLKAVQNKLGISYANAKKRYADILKALELTEKSTAEVFDMDNWNIDNTSLKASEIIKFKLKENGGTANVTSLTGKIYEIRVIADGKIYCDELLSSPRYDYDVFDAIVECIKAQPNATARKGDGRGAKYGDENCNDTTIVGSIAKYMNKKTGDSVDDPVSVLSAILAWAEIVENKKGYLELTEDYKTKIESTKLANRFETELIENAETAKKKYGYNPTYYFRMIDQEGGVRTAKILIQKTIKEGLAEGFLKLIEYNAVELSMEASVCKPEYQRLFTAEEIKICNELCSINKKLK